jgi:peroxiredoxin Q/BCP
MLEPGKPFPAFALPNQDGVVRRNADYAGRWLVAYFYPKDDTPGCTIQGQSFTASRSDFEGAGIAVVGVSQDDVASHHAFHDKFAFTNDLLADTGARLQRDLGIGQTEYKGTMYWDRTTFVVDPQGTVRKVYEKVKPEGHETAVLQDIAALKAARSR